MFLLDTSVISELRKPRPHGALLSWYGSQSPYSLFLPSIALYELQAGVEGIRRRDADKASEIERWIDEIAEGAEILSLDGASARMTASLMHGKSQDLVEDAMIAAIALSNRLIVATRNTKDFKQFGVATVNPFIDLRG